MSTDRTTAPAPLAPPAVPAPEEVRAFIPVRLSAGTARPDGSVLVYLPDGTGVAVPRRVLVFTDASSARLPP